MLEKIIKWGRQYMKKPRGSALNVVRRAEFYDGQVLRARDINKLVYAIRALDRKVSRRGRV